MQVMMYSPVPGHDSARRAEEILIERRVAQSRVCAPYIQHARDDSDDIHTSLRGGWCRAGCVHHIFSTHVTTAMTYALHWVQRMG